MPSLFNNQYNNLASKGRYGDTMLAHINPQEAGLLRAMGGAGTINPQTGLPEFFGIMGGLSSFPQRVEEPLPSLGQALAPESLANLTTKLDTITVPAEYRGLQGFTPAYEKVNPELNQYADRDYAKVLSGGANIEGYTIPTDKTFQNIPLVAQYDTQGNFKHLTLESGQYLYPDPSQPNIVSAPKINAKGEIIDYGVGDLNEFNSGGGLGGFVKDFAPMFAIGLGANYLAGSGLLGGGGATAADIAASNALAQANLTGYAGTAFSAIPTGTGLLSTAVGTGSVPLGPYVSQAAGAYGGSTAAANAAAAGNLTGITNAALAQNTLTADALARTGLTYGGNLTPASIPTTGPTPTQYPTPSPTTGSGSGSPLSGVTPNVVPPPIVPPVTSTITPSMLDSIAKATGISVDTLKTFAPSVIQGLIGAGGSYLTSEQATDAARTQADAQIRAAQIAADAARFRPVGVTTRFGTSNFTTDAAGNVVTAGYTPSAEITGYQDRLRGLAGQGLTDVEGARATYAPLSSAAQNLFSLGQGYLAKTPEQAAQEYIAKQTALLAPSRQNQLAELRNRQFQTGRGGVAVSQGGNLMNTNPEMAAYYNSLAQSDLALAAQADQEARNRITYGAGLFDTGANLQGRYYTGQTAAYSPFTTAIDTSSGLERLAQQPLDLSTAIGQKVSTATADVGRLTGQGIINAAGTMAPANAYSLGGNLLSGAAGSPMFASAVNKAFGNTQPTQQQYTYDPVSKQFVPVQQFVA